MHTPDYMSFFLAELEEEYQATRKCLERIPENMFDYKPHPSSMNMGYLSLLVAEIPLWIALGVSEGIIDFATFKHVQPKTTQELVNHFEDNFSHAKKVLNEMSAENFSQEFKLQNQGNVLMKQTKMELVRSSINHWVHHRGQLTVYMRMSNISVPSIYGPSGDDKRYQGQA